MRRRYKKSNHLRHRFSWFQGGRFGRDSYILIFILLFFVAMPVSLPLGLIVLGLMFIFAVIAENKEFKRREIEIEDEGNDE